VVSFPQGKSFADSCTGTPPMLDLIGIHTIRHYPSIPHCAELPFVRYSQSSFPPQATRSSPPPTSLSPFLFPLLLSDRAFFLQGTFAKSLSCFFLSSSIPKMWGAAFAFFPSRVILVIGSLVFFFQPSVIVQQVLVQSPLQE